jgi:hypothetical protein
VQGAALGGGTGLTAACDMAVASDDAAFSTSEVKFGIIPSVISPYVLRAIGPRHALRYFQSAERISGALAIGWPRWCRAMNSTPASPVSSTPCSPAGPAGGQGLDRRRAWPADRRRGQRGNRAAHRPPARH